MSAAIGRRAEGVEHPHSPIRSTPATTAERDVRTRRAPVAGRPTGYVTVMEQTWAVIGRGVRTGVLAGLAGTVAMTASEKIEQAVTGRPNSYIPAHAMERFLGMKTKPDEQRKWLGWIAHWSLGVFPAALRGVMAEGGMRGPMASTLFLATRVATDETMENVSGVGKAPWDWKASLAAIDVPHKGVYAFATGLVADRLASTPPPRAAREGGHWKAAA